ncbi:appetite-regulating hormone [Rhinophrynus dorsalis]
MLGRVIVCGIVMLCLLWPEEVTAGSSFLSPADLQKNSGKRPPKKLTNNVHRRDAGGSWDNSVDQLTDDEREIQVKFPLDINLKMTEEQFEQQKAAVQEILFGFFSLSPSQDIQDETE